MAQAKAVARPSSGPSSADGQPFRSHRARGHDRARRGIARPATARHESIPQPHGDWHEACIALAADRTVSSTGMRIASFHLPS